MAAKSQRPKHRDVALSSLNVAVEAVNFAKELSGVKPAKAVIGTVSVILTMIGVSFLSVCVKRLQDEMELGHYGQESTRRIMSSLGWPAPMSVPRSGGD